MSDPGLGSARAFVFDKRSVGAVHCRKEGRGGRCRWLCHEAVAGCGGRQLAGRGPGVGLWRLGLLILVDAECACFAADEDLHDVFGEGRELRGVGDGGVDSLACCKLADVRHQEGVGLPDASEVVAVRLHRLEALLGQDHAGPPLSNELESEPVGEGKEGKQDDDHELDHHLDGDVHGVIPGGR